MCGSQYLEGLPVVGVHDNRERPALDVAACIKLAETLAGMKVEYPPNDLDCYDVLSMSIVQARKALGRSPS